MDLPVNVPIDDANADTEWNEILRKHGVIPEKPPSPTPIIQKALEEAQRRAQENRLENKDLDELHELEDEEDEAFLEKYRTQRLAELSSMTAASTFNQVYPLQKPDYLRDVTEASKTAFVLVHLMSSLGTNTESRLLTELWREMAHRYGDIKFCEIRADMCIDGYPENNTPTILVYRNGDVRKQLITLRDLGGENTGMRDLQTFLISVGAIKPNDWRLLRNKNFEGDSINGNPRSGMNIEESDNDWD